MTESNTGQLAPMRVISCIDPAIKHSRSMLFGPFNFNRWVQIGVIILFDVWLTGGGCGMNFPSNTFSPQGGGSNQFDMSTVIRHMESWVMAHLSGLVLFGGLGILLIAVIGILFLWLTSRGQLMFIRCVALDDEDIGRNWREVRESAWSLFKFRFVLNAACWIVSIPFYVPMYMAVHNLAAQGEKGMFPYFLNMLPYVIIAVLVSLPLAVVQVLLRSFVSPLMFQFNLSCLDAWREFKRILPGNGLALLGYLGIKIIYSFGFGIVAMVGGCLTCCIGFLPLVHHTLFSPFYVFDRAFPLFMLQTLGPDYTVIRTEEVPPPLDLPNVIAGWPENIAERGTLHHPRNHREENAPMPSDPSALPWYKSCLVGMEVGPTGAQTGIDPQDVGYATRFSGKEIVERAMEANSDYLVIWAKDGEFAYYNSRVAPKCPGLGERDVLRECVDAAAPHGLPIIAYCVMQCCGYSWRPHPEYRMVGADGKEIGRICFNSTYIEHAKELADEMLAYGIAGFHFDMIDQGFGPPYGCWCARCRERFQAEYGAPMPKGVTWDADWDRMMEFRFNTSARFEKELLKFVRAKNPTASVDFNYHGYPPFSWEVGQRPVQHAHVGDFVTGESGVWAFGALLTSLDALFLAATKPGAPYQVVMQRGVRVYHDQTTRPVNDMRWETMTLLSHGAVATMVDKTPYDGSLDRVAYERIGHVFAEARGKREHFGHKPVQEVGLLYSSRSRDWYGKETPARYQQAFLGAHKALVYEHIPMGVLLDETLSLERLQAFPVVYLPNAAILSDHEVSLLREYVSKGGSLLATGFTGLFGHMGEELSACTLGDLIGGKFIEKLPSLDNHVRLAGSTPELVHLNRDIPLDWPFLVHGPGAIFAPTTATPYGELFRPHRTLRQQKGQEGTDQPNSADCVVGPAMLINRHGKGRIVYLPCSPDAAIAGEYGMAEARLLIRNVVRYLNPEPEVDILAPRHVESVVTDDAANRLLRIHLVGYLSPPGCTPARNRPYTLPSLVEDIPMFRATIRVRRPIKNVRALNPETRVAAEEGCVRALVNDIHETLILEY